MPAIQLMLLTKNMLTLANSILDGSEPFQDDMSMNNYRIKNVHTLVNDYGAVDRILCETRYRKMTNDHQLKISNDGRWDAKDKTDQYRYLGNCPPTPSLTQQQSIDNKLRLMSGRGRWAVAQILILIRQNDNRPQKSTIRWRSCSTQ